MYCSSDKSKFTCLLGDLNARIANENDFVNFNRNEHAENDFLNLQNFDEAKMSVNGKSKDKSKKDGFREYYSTLDHIFLIFSLFKLLRFKKKTILRFYRF